MEYKNVVEARFLRRPNRFIAHAQVGDREVVAHVRNTGRCRELLVPNATVYLEHAPHPGRKTDYSLIAVEKNGILINMDSGAPNKVVGEALESGWLPPGCNEPIAAIRREVTFGDSRIDFRVETASGPCYIEVKGVTLEEDGEVLFPDAPTQRGVRHLHELAGAVEQGMNACVVFVVQMEGVRLFRPNNRTHSEFGTALLEVQQKGVAMGAYTCRVTPNSMLLAGEIPIFLR